MAKEAADPPTTTSSIAHAKSGLPSGNLVVKCTKCKEILIVREWEKNLKVCTRCNFHFKLTAYERIELLVDPESFVELDADIVSVDPLHFVSRTKDEVQAYASKLDDESNKVGLNEAVVVGHATIEQLPLSLAIMDFRFIGGSMGSAVGEKNHTRNRVWPREMYACLDCFSIRRCAYARGIIFTDANGKNFSSACKTR